MACAALVSKGLQSAPRMVALVFCPCATRDLHLTHPRCHPASFSILAIRLPTTVKSHHWHRCLLPHTVRRRRGEVNSAGNLAASSLELLRMRASARCVSLSTGKTMTVLCYAIRGDLRGIPQQLVSKGALLQPSTKTCPASSATVAPWVAPCWKATARTVSLKPRASDFRKPEEQRNSS